MEERWLGTWAASRVLTFAAFSVAAVFDYSEVPDGKNICLPQIPEKRNHSRVHASTGTANVPHNVQHQSKFTLLHPDP